MKIIIIATFSLLVAGLIISFNSMKDKEISDPNELEISRLEKRIAQLESAQSQPAHTELGFTEALAKPTELEDAARAQSIQAELERTRAEMAKLKNDNAEKEAIIAENEQSLSAPVMKNGRANLVVTALTMARISEYNSEAQMAEIQIEHIGNVNTGDVLGIRRNSGIIGRVTVGTIDRDRGVVDPIPGSFMNGDINIQIGDELILPPQY